MNSGAVKRGSLNRAQAMRAQWKPLVTAIVAGGLAGLIAVLTFQAMTALEHLVWNTGAGPDGVGPVRIIVTILIGGALLILLGRIAVPETVDELLRDGVDARSRTRKRILVTILVAVVSIAFGGAIGPEAGLLAVVAECSAIVNRLIARDEALARMISQAGTAGALSGFYGSPPATSALEDELPAPGRLMSLVAGVSGFMVFLFVAKVVFGGEGVAKIPLPESVGGPEWLLIVPILVGAVLGGLFRAGHEAAGRLANFIGRPWLMTAIGTVLFAVLAALVPLVRFSGHQELADVVPLFKDGNTAELWLLAVAKLLALLLCLASGWRGGEVFPLIFIAATAGAAVTLMLPSLDPAAAMAATMAATLSVGWRRPLAALLLLAFVIEAHLMMPLLAGAGVGIIVDRAWPKAHTEDAEPLDEEQPRAVTLGVGELQRPLRPNP